MCPSNLSHTSTLGKVGYLGPGQSSFGYRATRAFLREADAELVPMYQHDSICRAVAEGRLDHGVIAIENSIIGMVDESARALARAAMLHENVVIQSELTIPVDLLLLARHQDPTRIERIVSHDAALGQCQRFLNSSFPGVPLQRADSTSAAAALAERHDAIAAIASAGAQTEYGLYRLHDYPIQDKIDNQTRFFLIGGTPAETNTPQHRKTAILLANLDRDAQGSLKSALTCFSEHGCVLSMIYPVPHPQRMWEYTFLTEFESSDDRSIQLAIKDYQALKLGDPPVWLGGYENRSSVLRLPDIRLACKEAS